jgi:hypothetical protein
LSSDTLSIEILIVFYGLIALTIFSTIYCILKVKEQKFSVLSLIISITYPFVFIIGAMQRTNGNEFEYFIEQLQGGSLWALYITISSVFLMYWWVSLIYLLTRKKEKKISA